MGERKLKLTKEVKVDPNTIVGANLTLKEFSKILHDVPDGYVTVATKTHYNDPNKKDVWIERNYTVDEWVEKIISDDIKGCYQSMNSFYRPKRGEEFCRSLHNFYVDVDYYKYGLSQDDVVQVIDFLIENGRIPEPTFLVNSGRGLYCIWNFESTPGKFTSVKKLYSHIQTFLIDALKEVGSDAASSDIPRMLKAPGSTNPKNQKRVEILRYSEKKYTMRYMQEFMNDVNDYQPTPKTTKKKKSTIYRLYNYYTLAVNRKEDLEDLCKIRKYDISGYRSTLLHIFSYQQMLIHKDYFIVYAKTSELNDKLLEPLSSKDIQSTCQNSARAFRNKQEDNAKGYNYKTKTIIKKLDITLDEQRQMKALVGEEIKNERRSTKRKIANRNEDGLTKRELKKQELILQVKTLHSQGLKQKEIAEKLIITKGRVSQILKNEKV